MMKMSPPPMTKIAVEYKVVPVPSELPEAFVLVEREGKAEFVLDMPGDPVESDHIAEPTLAQLVEATCNEQGQEGWQLQGHIEYDEGTLMLVFQRPDRILQPEPGTPEEAPHGRG